MATYSDNFNRANGALGDNWTLNDTDRTAPVILSNQLVHSGAATREFVQYVGGAFANDQYSKAEVVTLDDQWLLVRCQTPSTTENCYALNIWDSAGTQYYNMGKFVGSTITFFLSDTVLAISTGDIIEFRAVGTVLSIWKNGQLVEAYDDTGAEFSSGDAGIGTFGTSSIWDNWEGGDMTYTAPYSPSFAISNISWDQTGLDQKGLGSDMWPCTWGDDDLIYVSYGDGGGINGTDTECRTRLGIHALTGTPASFTASNIMGRKSDGSGGDTGGTSNPVCDASFANPFTGQYGDGLIAIGSVLYLLLTDQTAPLNSSLAHSEDYGETWTEYGWNWNRDNVGDWYPFGFVHFGKANAGAVDSYLYLVGGAMSDDQNLFLARVSTASIGTQESYEWYTSVDPSSPAWGTWANAQPIFSDVNNAYTGGICYFPVIKRYIMAASHGNGNPGNLEIQKLGVFDAPAPWGPWRTAYYANTWLSLGSTYALQYNIIQKWTSADNSEIYMSFSSTGSLDSWNLVKGTLTLNRTSSPFPFPILN